MSKIEPTLQQSWNDFKESLYEVFEPLLNKLTFIITCLSTVRIQKEEEFVLGYEKAWHDGYHYILDCGFFSVSWFY